jgi:starvation-inducible DNA-binding protein
MNDLIKALNVVHANTFIMYFKAHSFHWNVEGKDFYQYHEFFGDLYEELFAAVDPIAEQIRALDSYAPKSLAEMYNHATLNEQSDIAGNELQKMLNSLLEDNTEVISSLNKAFSLADEANEQGLADLIASRLDVHKKHGWMLRASSKG